MAKSKVAERLETAEGEIEDLKYEAAHVATVVRGCSSIPVDWVEVGGIRVGLDSGGDAVEVRIPHTLHGWDLTQYHLNGEVQDA